jgi:hypothetical protein
MSIQVFGIVFLLGAAAIALWLDARFPGIAPPDLRRALLRALIALGASEFLFPPVWEAALARSPALIAVFAIALPCLTWLLLSTIWAIRQLQATLRGQMY